MIDVKAVAKLARLQLTEAEEAQFQAQLTTIIKNFEEIEAIPTEGIEPLVTPTDIEHFYREDVAETLLTPQEALANAPEKSGNLFRVPPVV